MTAMDIGQIAAMLADRADGLARELLPAGHREGDEWVEARRCQGGLGDSLRVNLAKGTFAHFASSDPSARGDLLDLVAYVNFRGDKKQAVRWARRWLGIDDADPAELEIRRRKADKAKAARDEEERRERERRSRSAFKLFLSGQERIAGTPADLYLIGRGLDLRRLGRQPGALRFHPAVREPETGRAMPCLLAAITRGSRIVAVHRTWLAKRPGGSWAKAVIGNPKKSLGPVHGGAVRIWNGERVDPKTGEVKPGYPLAKAGPGIEVAITEGIEDALSVALAMPHLRVMAAVSLANMAALVLPDTVAAVTIVADNDAADSQAAAALDRAVQAHLKAGRKVRLVRPPEGVKDVNELLNRERNTG